MSLITQQHNNVRNCIIVETQTTIWVTFSKEGIHCYPEAKNIDGVDFLQHPHRHIFHFRVEIDVYHDDRDIEFIKFKRELQDLYEANGPMQIDHKSCEMLANDIIEYLANAYPSRNVTVTVSEDNENGATVKAKYSQI